MAILDGRLRHAYMRLPMNRILLALLALFAGIATQVSPAEARVRGETEIGSVMAQRSATRAAASAQAPVPFQPKTSLTPCDRVHSVPAHYARPHVPTVRLGPDRARE